MITYINGTSALKEENNVEEQPKKKGNYKEGEEQRVYPFKTE